jgi:DNA-binding LacI/PurR family transcriptional regulator
MRYEELFEKALHTPATAWVCDNDLAGLAALDFLTDRGKQVPGDIAVMGFDNIADALRQGLTSYDFAIPRLTEMVLRYVTERKTTPPEGKQIEGYLVERRSTNGSRRP